MRLTFFFFSILICSSCQTKQKFDKLKWRESGDMMTFPNRKYMIDDVVKKHELKGKRYNEIVELLDKPQHELDTTMQIIYDVDIDYGFDIDPVYIKRLSIDFDMDTIAKHFEITEWKK